jgi:hypothetical protein
MRNQRCGVLVCTLLVMGSSLLWGQSGTTSLRGVVSDANGAVLPGASITITDPTTGFTRSVQTENDGTYQFLQLQPTVYVVEVSANGFAKLKREDVRLQVNTPSTMNFTMQVSATKVEIEVTSEAPLVNTQDASIGNVFNARQLVDLPSEGRDPVSILSLQPGVAYIGNQVDQTNDSRGGSVAGARSDQTNITWDGLDNNDQLTGNAFEGALRSTLDSLQEFRVTTNSGNADEGRSSGAQVSLVTKSGTNSFQRRAQHPARPWIFRHRRRARQGMVDHRTAKAEVRLGGVQRNEFRPLRCGRFFQRLRPEFVRLRRVQHNANQATRDAVLSAV